MVICDSPDVNCGELYLAGMKMVLAMEGVELLNLLLVTVILGHFTAVNCAVCAEGDKNALLQFKAGNNNVALTHTINTFWIGIC